jgi:TRAP-type transport system large permease protein
MSSAVADAAGVGRIVIDMMKRSGHYSGGYAAALTAASATIGPIIPPSIPMVLYALVSNTSIGYLFLGGVTPGLVMGVVLMAMNTLYAHRRGIGVDKAVPLREIPGLTLQAFPALLMPVILLYGIYGGIATPTEAAAIAAAYALILAALFYRSLTLGAFYRILVESARPSAAVGIVIGGALVLNYIVASENIGTMIAQALTGINVSPLAFMFGVNLLLLVLGCVLDASTIILVIIPLFIPTCRELGIDLIYFGVIAVVNTMIGLITPPYGILLFVINATTRIPLNEIIREIWAFIAALIFALLLMILFPDIILWLPRLLGYAG